MPKAIDAFKTVLSQQQDHLDAQEHLYGLTCGLLPNGNEHGDDEATRNYLKGKYARVIGVVERERWMTSDAQLVLLISALTMNKESARLYELGQSFVEERYRAEMGR